MDIDKTECINSLNYIDSYIKEHLTNFSMEEVHPLLSTLYDNETLKVLYLTRDSLDHISNDKIRLFLKLALSQTMHKVGLYPIAVPYISRTKRMGQQRTCICKISINSITDVRRYRTTSKHRANIRNISS